MAMMKAAIWYGPGRENFRLESIERPEPTEHELLIKVHKCFFAAMHVRAVLVGHAKHQPPEIFGRMFSGEIVAVGSAVDHWQPGMRVTLNPERPCGVCFYCQREQIGHCLQPTTLKTGGMAEFVCVPAPLIEGLFEIPPHVSMEAAAYTETLACILRGLELASINVSDTVVIMGSGGVGLSFVQLARLRAASKIIVSGRTQSLETAVAFGATRVVHVNEESLEAVVNQETSGHGADVVIEAVGSAETYAQSLRLLRCGGTMVAFGGTPPGTLFDGDPNIIHYRSLKIYGSYRYTPDHFRRAFNLICTGQIDLRPIITHSVPFSDLTTHAVDLYRQADCRALVIDMAA